MRNMNIYPKSKNKSQTNSETDCMELYMQMLKNDPKPQNMSKSAYLMYLTLQILPKLGNICPSQEEINLLESMIKRYSNRKSIKLVFENINIHSTHPSI